MDIRDASPTDRDAMAAVSAAAGVSYSPGGSWGWPEADSGLVVGLPRTDARRGIMSGMSTEELVLVGARLHERSLKTGQIDMITPATIAKRIAEFNGTELDIGTVADTLAVLHAKGLTSTPQVGATGKVAHINWLTEDARARADGLIGES
jgi:hypothetical protein